MKRTICFLTVIILLCGSAACADRHLNIRCIPAGDSGAAVTFDLYEQEDDAYMLSSLFPDFAYRTGLPEGNPVSDFTTMISLHPEQAAEAEKDFASFLTAWLESRLSDPVYGNWAGELFDHASSMRTAGFGFDELRALFDAQPVPQGPDSPGFRFLISQLTRCMHSTGYSGMKVSFRSFDEGKYISAAVSLQDDVIMTISADCSESSVKRILVSYRESGKYCFRNITFRFGEDSFSVSSAFRSGESSSSVSRKDSLLFSETFTAKSDTETSDSFEWTFAAPSLGDPLIISGTSTSGEDGFARLAGSVCIGDSSNEVIRISADAEPLARPVLFSDKTIVSAEKLTGSSEILLSAVSGWLLFTADILPALPESYRNLLMNLPIQ